MWEKRREARIGRSAEYFSGETGSTRSLSWATTADEVARSDTPISTRAHIRRNRPKVAHMTCGLYDARADVKPRVRTYETTRSANVLFYRLTRCR